MHIHTEKTYQPNRNHNTLRATHSRPGPETLLSRTDYRRIVAEILG